MLIPSFLKAPQRPSFTKRKATIATALLCLLASPFLASSLSAQATFPKLEVSQPSLTLDTVFRGQTTSATFDVENTGDAPLEILNGRTSCPCAKLDYPKAIAPGETGTVTVTIDTLKLSGPTRVNIFLNTNDPDEPSPKLQANVESKDALAANPGTYRYLVYQNFAGTASITQTIVALDNTDIEITKVESPYDFLTIGEPRPATDAERILQYTGKQWSFDAVLDNAPPVGALTGAVTVHTNHPSQPIIPIPVSGFVRPLAAATPHIVKFGQFDMPESGTYLETTLKQYAEELIEIVRIESEVEGITGETRDVVAGRHWKVRVIANPELAEGPFKGNLILHTNHPRQKTITIPVQGNRAASADSGS